jgi:hypothetical protein
MMTEEQIKQYHDKVDDNIKKYGYHATFVFAGLNPSFCYSTGIYKSFGMPEVFISSLPQNLSHELIEKYIRKFKGMNEIPLNQKIDGLTDRFPVYLINVPQDNLKDHILSSIRVYGASDYQYVQLIYPDPRGYFPNDPGYDYDQVIFGEFTN